MSEAPKSDEAHDEESTPYEVDPGDAAPAGHAADRLSDDERTKSADQTDAGVDDDDASRRRRRRRRRRQAEADAASPTAAPKPPPRRVPRKTGWIILLVCMLLILPTMTLELAGPDVIDQREAVALTRSVHTYANFNSLTDPTATFYERSEPNYNGRPDLTVRPMVTWTQMIGFSIVPGAPDAGPVPIKTRIFQARLMSVFMALLVIGAVYWAGLSIGGPYAALIAALVCATNPILIMHARIASEPIHTLAWEMLSIAAALWAIRPLRPAASVERQFIGWVISGITLGVAILTVGPPAVPAVVVPVALILVLCPNRVSHLMGLLAALLIGLLLPMPWAVYAHEHDRQAWSIDLAQLFPQDALVMSGVSYLAGGWLILLLLLLLPWTLWLIGAVIQPFSTSSAGSRTRLFLGWSWFAVTIAVVMVTTRGELGDLLPLVPAASVLIGQLFAQYSDLAAEGRYPRVWRYGKWLHLALLMLASIGVGFIPLAHERLVASGWIEQPMIGELNPWIWGLLACALVGILVMCIRWVRKDYPGRVAVTWCVWAAAMAPVLMLSYAHAPRMHSEAAADAESLTQTDRTMPIFNLSPHDEYDKPVDPVALLYGQRLIATVGPQHLAELSEQDQPYYLLTPISDRRPTPVAEPVRRLSGLDAQLWLINPKAAAIPETNGAADPSADQPANTELDSATTQVSPTAGSVEVDAIE